MAEELTDRVDAMIEKAQDELGGLVAAEVHKVRVEQLSRTTDHLDKKDDDLDATISSAIEELERRLMAQTHGSTKMAEEMTDRVEAMIEEAEEELRSLVEAEVYKAQMDLIKSVGQLLDKKDNQLDATVTAAIRRVERRLMSQVRKLEKE